MTTDRRMMYMLPATVTLAPRASGQLVFVIPSELAADKLLTPQRITVNTPPHIVSVDQFVSALRVAGKSVSANLTQTLGSRFDDQWEPPMMPACKAGDQVVLCIVNPTDAELKVDAVLAVLEEPAHYLRLEETTPEMVPGGGPCVIVLRVPQSARIVRFELETADEWSPPGWIIEQITVSNTPQMFGVVSSELILAAPSGALHFNTVMIGTDITVKVSRAAGEKPEALTVRAVLEPVVARAIFNRSNPEEMRQLRAELYGDDGGEDR